MNKEVPFRRMYKNQRLQRDGSFSYYGYTRCSKWFPCISPQLLALFLIEWVMWARMLSVNFAEMMTSTPFRDLLHAANLRQLYFPSEGRRAEDFFALKNPTASAGFEPANLDTKGQHATPRLPKQIVKCYLVTKSVASNLRRW